MESEGSAVGWVFSLWGKARWRAWPLLAVLAGVAMAAVLAMATNAQGTTSFKVALRPLGSPGAVSLSGLTCTNAVSKLNSETTSNRFTLAIAPLHYPKLTVTNVTISTDATACTTLVLQGSAMVFNQHAQVLVVGHWATATATSPTFTVALDFSTVGLGTLLTSSGSSVDATFTQVWLTATSASGGSTLALTTTATTGAHMAISHFFTGFQGSTVTVKGSGLNFAGELSSTGQLATGLSKLGVTNLQLTGSLTGSLTNFTVSTPPTAAAGFTVTASFGLNIPTLPGWLTFPSNAFSLSVSGTSTGNWSVAVTGNATVKLPPTTTTTPVTAIFTVSKSGKATPVTVGLSVNMGKVSHAFGLNWLTLTTTKVTWAVSKSSRSATLHAKVTLGSTSSTLGLTATVTLSSTTGAIATLSLTTTGKQLSTTNLATDIGVSLPAHTPTVTLKHLAVYLKVPKGAAATVSVEAAATLGIGTNSVPVSFLVRSEASSLIVAAKTTTPFTLQQLDSTVPTWINVSLTHLAVLFSTANVTLKSATVDAPTKTFFKPLYCTPSSTTCTFTVAVKAGVTIQASVGLPTSVKQMVCKLVVSNSTATCLTGPVTIDGHLPLFDATTFSLSIALPTVTLSSSSVKRLTLALALTEDQHTISVSASGKLVLLVPSYQPPTNGNCPTGVTRLASQMTDICVTLDLTGTLNAGPQGVSVTFSAVVTPHTGWRLPQPVTWLTVDRLAAQIGIKAGKTGAGLTVGVAGKFDLGTTTLGFALDVQLTPNAPWVELLGFKVQSVTGIGRAQIADLYHDVTGNSLTPSDLPPLALKDLLFEYAATNDPTLGLCQGLHISADLVITNGHWTGGGSAAPTSVTCGTTSPTRTTTCTSNGSSCLASVLITITPNGFIGRGYLTGWSAGPVQFTPTTLELTITKSAIQVHISAGGDLLTPFTWPKYGKTSPEWFGGSITLTVGTERLHLKATGDIGGLNGTITSTGSLSTLENPFTNLASWFTTTVKGALETAGTHIKTAMTTVGTTVKGWYTTYIAPNGDKEASAIQNAYKFFGNTGPPNWVKVESVIKSISTAISTWNSAVSDATLTFLAITVGPIFNDALHGIHVNGWTICVAGKCATIIPGFTIPGVCSYVSTLEGSPLCTASTPVAGAQQEFADPSVNSHLTSATLSLPPGASDKTLVKKIHAVDPPGTTGITCAMATENYATGTESNTDIQVKTLGNTVTISGPNPSTLGNSTDQTSNNTQLGQDTLNSLYSGVNQGTCSPPSAQKTIPTLSLALLQSRIYKGGTVTSVVHAGTGITSVTITWGDGASTPATYTATSKVYRASHVYTEKGTFLVTASAAVSSGTAPAPVTTRINVFDAPPDISKLTVTPSTADVEQNVKVTGELLNPAQTGTPVSATITWGDGTTGSATVASTGDFAFTHTYERLSPPGAPSATEPISVVLSDTDGTTSSATASADVHDVPPTGLISPTSGGVVSSRGTVFTHVGTEIDWTPEVTDVSPQQGFTFAFTWNDGTSITRSTVTRPTPTTPNVQGQYTYPVALQSVAHTFANACSYTVTTRATDADSLSASMQTPVIVTAPLQFTPPSPSAFWKQQFSPSPKPPKLAKGHIGSATLACYLKVAQRLSPQLAPNLTPAAALAILQPAPPPQSQPPSQTAQMAAQVRQNLLTVLLDFANGNWNWTQELSINGGPHGPYEASLQTVVGTANQALISNTLKAMRTSLNALHQVQAPKPPNQLTWSPSSNGIHSFGTVADGKTMTQTFTITNRGPDGKLHPLPPALPVELAGSSAFLITANTCPSAPPPGPPPRTTCKVTVRFAPTVDDTPYSATLVVLGGTLPQKGGPPPPIAATLTISGTSA